MILCCIIFISSLKISNEAHGFVNNIDKQITLNKNEDEKAQNQNSKISNSNSISNKTQIKLENGLKEAKEENSNQDIDGDNENPNWKNDCGQNTIKTKEGKCICKEGFNYGNPNSSIGCYKCPSNCHKNAKCVPPGQCSCSEGMIGDGINSCEIPTPEILQIKPPYINSKGNQELIISYQLKTNYYQPNGFCRFDSVIIPGNITKNSELICLTPEIQEKSVKIAISFDGKNWSENLKSIGVEQPISMQKLIFDLVSCLFIFSGIPSFVRSHFCKKRKSGNYDILENPEGEPFKNQKDEKQGEMLFSEFA